MQADDLSRFAGDPGEFQRGLTIPSAHGPRRFGDVMAAFQCERFAGLNPSLLAVARGDKPACGRHWWEATKGASKDSDLAVCVLWLLSFSKRPLTIQVGAADADQAAELRKAASDVLRLNAWLSARVRIDNYRLSCAATGAVAEIIPADEAGSHGARPDVVILNELSHVTKQGFAENLLDNAAKVPHGLVVVATNAGFAGTWQEQWRGIAESSDRWLMHVWARPSPWIDAGELAEAERRNSRSRFLRLWWGEWSSGEGDAIDGELIDAAVTLAGPTSAPEPGWVYVAGLDLGLTRDSSALVVVGKHVGYWKETPTAPRPRSRMDRLLVDAGILQPLTNSPTREYIAGDGRLRLAAIDVFSPGGGRKVDVSSIERTAIELHERFRLSLLACDPWQAALLIERLQKQGVPADATNFTSAALSAMATATMGAFQRREIDLFHQSELIADLRALRVTERNTGIRLTSPRSTSGAGTAHGDTVTALALALEAATRYSYGPAPGLQGDAGRLVLWP